jgi:alkanesulfonate monooxygenase SsuD/methylene tetrahydromethanopterin reductase-like flavin-dependent oxidoreductase (luciferase family)
VTLTCRPVQKPHPPIWFAANSDAAVRRAARLGDTWFVNPHATMASITRQMGLYREELTRLGKPLPRVRPLIKETYCAKDRRTALELAGPFLGAKYRAYASWGQDAVLPDGDTFRGADFLFFRTHWLGMPLAHALASMRLMSDELLPALRQVKG